MKRLEQNGFSMFFVSIFPKNITNVSIVRAFSCANCICLYFFFILLLPTRMCLFLLVSFYPSVALAPNLSRKCIKNRLLPFKLHKCSSQGVANALVHFSYFIFSLFLYLPHLLSVCIIYENIYLYLTAMLETVDVVFILSILLAPVSYAVALTFSGCRILFSSLSERVCDVVFEVDDFLERLFSFGSLFD